MRIEYIGDDITISDFKPIEAYKIARRLEAEGISFYSLLLSAPEVKTTGGNSETERAIESLLVEERKHLRFFDQKIEELAGPFEESSIVDDVDTQVFSYYGEPVDFIAVVRDREKAIKMGMLFERRSINFFKACFKDASDGAAKNAFFNIIKEEEKHFEILKEMLKPDQEK